MYKTSAELKAEAKRALSGRWKDAVLLNIVPSLLRLLGRWVVIILMVISMIGAFALISNMSTSNYSYSTGQRGDFYDDSDLDEWEGDWDDDWRDLDDYSYSAGREAFNNRFNLLSLFPSGRYLFDLLFSLVISFLTIGISFTFLEVLRDPNRKIKAANDQFRMFNGKDFVPLLLVLVLGGIFKFLWSLLFVIPGIIKGYSYSQAFFIYKDLSEHTDTQSLSANNYITESKLLMDGHKGRLFYIDLSFIGWEIVSAITLGIGYLFLEPYKNATKAAFYRDISKDRYLAVNESQDEMAELSEEDEWTSF